jgi:hypothetical protein
LRLPLRHIGGGRDEKFLRLFELARVLVHLDHVASYFQATGRFLKRRESEKV